MSYFQDDMNSGKKSRFTAIFMAVGFALLMSLSTFSVADAGRKDKIDICHAYGNGQYKLLSVNGNAWRGHDRHGDALPGDNVPGQEDMTFNESCEMVEDEPQQPEQVTAVQNALSEEAITNQPSARYKSFANTGSQEVYAGVHDLGIASNRTGMDATWTEGTHDFTFTYDDANDKVAAWLNANEVSHTVVVGSAACDPEDWDTLQILVLDRDDGDSKLVLKDVSINGTQIIGPDSGDFEGQDNFADATWTAPYTFGDSFTLDAFLMVEGTFDGGDELSKVQFNVGCSV